MKRIFSKKILRWLNLILAIYIAGGVALFFLQDKLLFHPEKLNASYQYEFDIPFKEINLKVNKEKTLSIIQFTVPDSVCKGVVLFFHGNRQNISRYAKYAPAFTKNNYEVWMIDYPGFGKSTGQRTEEILYDDALLLYRMARVNFSPDSIVIYGKSIGTGIAAELAAVRDCKRLMLETPYYNIESLAQHYFPVYPVAAMFNYSFPINEYFEKITAPVTIFHGIDDQIIPFEQSEKLTLIKNKTELVAIKKGKHNNLFEFPLYHQKMDSLLSL
jgi:Lysophospholipase